jgi:hypothetical protein
VKLEGNTCISNYLMAKTRSIQPMVAKTISLVIQNFSRLCVHSPKIQVFKFDSIFLMKDSKVVHSMSWLNTSKNRELENSLTQQAMVIGLPILISQRRSF